MKASFIPSCAMLALVTGCGQAHIDGIDVRGQVTYQATGAPFPGAKVKVGDKPIATADGEGRFAVSSVVVPYDLTAVSADGTAATVYAGLTRKDPIISVSVPGGSPPATRSAIVTGHLGGGLALPLPARHQIVVALVAPKNARAGITATRLGLDGTYSLALRWQGEANLSGTLRALEWLVDANGNAVSYDAAVSVPMTVADAGSSQGVDLNLTTVDNARLAGTFSTAPGYQLLVHLMYAAYSPSSSLILGTSRSAGISSAAFDYPVFSAPGVGLGIRAIAQDSHGALVQAWRVGASPETAISLAVPAAPTLRVPAGTVSAGADFSWTPLDGAIYHFEANPQTEGAPSLDALTAATSFQLPDLSAMGFVWPKSASYSAFLFGVSPRVPDDVAAGEEFPPPDRDGVMAIASSSGFTIAP
ncbi:MAG: carboxypeptidase regulatory-like domain-containing protein [Deltaproteobacteria bacterium]|nr:MAG: carboxypeptidase regulatory-like domain-containing protein [Deltaproteobacteria bacterium]